MGLGIGMTWFLPLALTGASADIPVDQPAIPMPLAESVDEVFDNIQFQVRTRQRVMIRITPLSRVSPPPPSVPRRSRPAAPVAAGDEVAQCIPLGEVAGVRLGQGRSLLLYMRDRRVVRTLLERSCQVSSFYSGFYVERPADGMLCAGREALHARSGADCELSAFTDITGSDEAGD